MPLLCSAASKTAVSSQLITFHDSKTRDSQGRSYSRLSSLGRRWRRLREGHCAIFLICSFSSQSLLPLSCLRCCEILEPQGLYFLARSITPYKYFHTSNRKINCSTFTTKYSVNTWTTSNLAHFSEKICTPPASSPALRRSWPLAMSLLLLQTKDAQARQLPSTKLPTQNSRALLEFWQRQRHIPSSRSHFQRG